MFVVRIVGEQGKADFKAFTRKPDAEDRFYAAWNYIDGIDDSSFALFQVPDANFAPEGVEAVKSGRSGVVLLKKQPVELNLDLSVWDL